MKPRHAVPRGQWATRRKPNGNLAWREALTRKFYALERQHGTTEAVVRTWRAGMRAAYDARRWKGRTAAAARWRAARTACVLKEFAESNKS